MTNLAVEQSWTIPRPGETIAGKYVVDGLCGRGGLAVVLSALHAGLAQRVAIKMLLPEWAGDQEVVQRFVREGRAATRIKSEHVVRVFDVGTLESGAPYLVLEYLEGHNLDDVVAMWGSLPVSTAIDWVLQAAEAIAEAHAYGIVHRDLKPANLFLTQRADASACIKVLDFGLSKLTDPRMCDGGAKLTRPTDVMGSPHYMAPEQLRATRDVDARTDLWALGAVLHELLTGEPPFRGETMPELCATVLMQPPPRLSSLRADVPPEIEEAVLRCLEKDPSARFTSTAELARAVAPFGTELARSSCGRIERVLEVGGRTSELTPLPPRLLAPAAAQISWPTAPPMGMTSTSSGRVIFGSLLILTGLGVGAFLSLYALVHADEPHRAVAGVTAPQGTAQASPVAPANAATFGPSPAVLAGANAVASATTISTLPPTASPTPIPAATATSTPTVPAPATKTSTPAPLATTAAARGNGAGRAGSGPVVRTREPRAAPPRIRRAAASAALSTGTIVATSPMSQPADSSTPPPPRDDPPRVPPTTTEPQSENATEEPSDELFDHRK
jgi:eukaryotic-like serine/threonine-protein kinase